MYDSDEDDRHEESSAPRVPLLRRTTGYRNVFSIDESLKIPCGRIGESNPAQKIPGSAGPPGRGTSASDTVLKPVSIVQQSRLQPSCFTPLAFPSTVSRARPTYSSFDPLILTVDLVWSDPKVKADVSNKYFSQPQMFMLSNENAERFVFDERLVFVQFQMWVPYPFKPLINRLASLTFIDEPFDSEKLFHMSRIAADVLSPGIIAIEVSTFGQDENSNIQPFVDQLSMMFKTERSPDIPMSIFPDSTLSANKQKTLCIKRYIQRTADDSKEMCAFFNMIGRRLRRVIDDPDSITFPWRAFDKFGEWRTDMLRYFNSVALQASEDEETWMKFVVVLNVLSQTVDSMNDSMSLKQPVEVEDLHHLKSAVLDYCSSDAAVQKSKLLHPTDDTGMRVLLARDVAYEMFRCAFPQPPKIDVRLRVRE